MSTREGWFVGYFLIGLILMIVAVASPGHRERTKGFAISAIGQVGDGFGAVLFISIALLWPIWLVASLIKKEPKD